MLARTTVKTLNVGARSAPRYAKHSQQVRYNSGGGSDKSLATVPVTSSSKPRKSAWVAGRDMGIFGSTEKPLYRSYAFEEQPKPGMTSEGDLLANIEKYGHESGARRRARAGIPNPGIVPDAPDQPADTLSHEQILQSHPKKGERTFNRGTDVLGVHEDMKYTQRAAAMTAGIRVADLSHLQRKVEEENVRLRNYEYVPNGRPLASMEEAYAANPHLTPGFDPRGEFGVRGGFGPENTGHVSETPLNQDILEQRYLSNLAQIDSSPANPKRYRIKTHTRTHPGTGQPFEIDHFEEDDG